MAVSDYVSIKHILCPAINVLIAGEREHALSGFNNGFVFIRGHSEVGKTCNPSVNSNQWHIQTDSKNHCKQCKMSPKHHTGAFQGKDIVQIHIKYTQLVSSGHPQQRISL